MGTWVAGAWAQALALVRGLAWTQVGQAWAQAWAQALAQA